MRRRGAAGVLGVCIVGVACAVACLPPRPNADGSTAWCLSSDDPESSCVLPDWEARCERVDKVASAGCVTPESCAELLREAKVASTELDKHDSPACAEAVQTATRLLLEREYERSSDEIASAFEDCTIERPADPEDDPSVACHAAGRRMREMPKRFFFQAALELAERRDLGCTKTIREWLVDTNHYDPTPWREVWDDPSPDDQVMRHMCDEKIWLACEEINSTPTAPEAATQACECVDWTNFDALFNDKGCVGGVFGGERVIHKTPPVDNVATMFDVGALSKEFLAAAIFNLVDRKVLSLSEKVQTLIDLQPSLSSSLTVSDLLAEAPTQPVCGGPGDYPLLAQVLQHLSGTKRDLGSLLQDGFFAQVGMKNAIVGDEADAILRAPFADAASSSKTAIGSTVAASFDDVVAWARTLTNSSSLRNRLAHLKGVTGWQHGETAAMAFAPDDWRTAIVLCEPGGVRASALADQAVTWLSPTLCPASPKGSSGSRPARRRPEDAGVAQGD